MKRLPWTALCCLIPFFGLFLAGRLHAEGMDDVLAPMNAAAAPLYWPNPEAGEIVGAQSLKLVDANTRLAYNYLVCKGTAGAAPAQSDCTDGKNGLEFVPHVTYLPLALIVPGTVKAMVDLDRPGLHRVVFACQFDRRCNADDPPAFWGDRGALLCADQAACDRLAGALISLVGLAREAEVSTRTGALKELETLRATPKEGDPTADDVHTHLSALRRLLQGDLYAAMRSDGTRSVIALTWLDVGFTDGNELLLRYAATGCTTSKASLAALIDSCRTADARMEALRGTARVDQFDLRNARLADGAASGKNGQGYLFVAPCNAKTACVTDALTGKAEQGLVVPCRHPESCVALLKEIEFLAKWRAAGGKA